MAVTSTAVRTITAGVHRHWLLGPVLSNVIHCSIAPRSSTTYHDGVQRQRSYLTSHCPTLEAPSVRRWRHPPVYRPLVDLSTMEERHVIITYRLDRATIQELCTQLEPDLMSAIRHPTGIPPEVQVLNKKAPIGSSGCTRTGAKSNFQADRDGALLGYRSREASVKKLPSDLVFILKFFFTGTNLPVGSDLLEPLSGYAKSVSSVVIFTFGLSRFFEMKILRAG
ncbi:hypothetical protein NDU88_007430 [Pleurodeles waltl]|uniref:Uncharacterized protein n=1 Tax=Pleurodeles waltl TaxID=8319 RepID=A0AAV7VSB7_PLEWA|nr:hypothetical protein NDU88_007430 [Pleurodeles waltl]